MENDYCDKDERVNEISTFTSSALVSDYINVFEEKFNQPIENNWGRRSSMQSPTSTREDFSKINNSINRNQNKSLKKTIAINNLNNSTSLEIAEVATMNEMELCTIEDIDFSQIPGYIKIPDNIPDWKKYHLERKNKDAINIYLSEKQKEENEKNKYGDIPQWKKNLLMKKEKEKINLESLESDKFGNIPQWKKDLLVKKQIPNHH